MPSRITELTPSEYSSRASSVHSTGVKAGHVPLRDSIDSIDPAQKQKPSRPAARFGQDPNGMDFARSEYRDTDTASFVSFSNSDSQSVKGLETPQVTTPISSRHSSSNATIVDAHRAAINKEKEKPLHRLMIEAQKKTSLARNMSKYFMFTGIGVSFVLLCTGHIWAPLVLVPAFLAVGAGVAFVMRNWINKREDATLEAFNERMLEWTGKAAPHEFHEPEMIEAQKIYAFLNEKAKTFALTQLTGSNKHEAKNLDRLQRWAKKKAGRSADEAQSQYASTVRPEYEGIMQDFAARKAAEKKADNGLNDTIDETRMPVGRPNTI